MLSVSTGFHCSYIIIIIIPQIALAVGVLTSSLGVGDSNISRVVAGGDVIEDVVEGVVSYGVLVAVLDRRNCRTGWEVWSSVSTSVSLVVFDGMWPEGVAEGVAWGVAEGVVEGVIWGVGGSA